MDKGIDSCFRNGEEVERKSSVILPQLRDIERQFFDLVNVGNVAEVRSFVNDHPNLNANCVNFQGISALHVAVEDRNAPMVEFLLSRSNIDVGDAVLRAIRNNDVRILAMTLDHLRNLSPGLEYAGTTRSSDFPDHATPLMIAAKNGNYELIAFLIERGHLLARPHPSNCYCDDLCKPQRCTEDPLMVDKTRLSLYEALANPAYICQTDEDPILVAFQLAVELNEAASYEREFAKAYRRLSDMVAKFATDLIGCARTSEEVEVVLKRSPGLRSSSNFIYPRLLLAMDCKMKTFVAHPNVQQLMEMKWRDGWYEWKIRSIQRKVSSVIPRIFALPFIVLWVLVAPNSKRSAHWAIPVNKFLSFVASYLVFLVFVFIESNLDKRNQLRGPPDTGFEIVLVIYVLAYTWASFRLCVINGPRRFFRIPWNWYEVAMLLLFSTTFLFWAAAVVDVNENGQRDLERKYWHRYDPTLIAEGTFCIATIMAFFKLLFVCQLDHVLGPLQMSLGKMIADVAKFIVIFSVILLSFSAGLTHLYQYYEGMVRIDDATKIKIQQVDSFVDFISTMKTLFWAIFCMSAIESADVVIENLPGDTENETVLNYHNFTEAIGYLAFAGFEFISVVVAMNMLIACMSNTFIKVTDNVQVEWMFGRTQVYIDFMVESTLPAPFNLIPTASGFNAIGEFIKVLVNPPPNKSARWSPSHCCYVENREEDTKDDTFAIVMAQLVQRYFRKKDTEPEATDLEGLRKDLVELRAVLREALSPSS